MPDFIDEIYNVSNIREYFALIAEKYLDKLMPFTNIEKNELQVVGDAISLLEKIAKYDVFKDTQFGRGEVLLNSLGWTKRYETNSRILPTIEGYKIINGVRAISGKENIGESRYNV